MHRQAFGVPGLMNFSANMLGLDNAATPLGLKAMKQLQEVNTSDVIVFLEDVLLLTLLQWSE